MRNGYEVHSPRADKLIKSLIPNHESVECFPPPSAHTPYHHITKGLFIARNSIRKITKNTV